MLRLGSENQAVTKKTGRRGWFPNRGQHQNTAVATRPPRPIAALGETLAPV